MKKEQSKILENKGQEIERMKKVAKKNRNWIIYLFILSVFAFLFYVLCLDVIEKQLAPISFGKISVPILFLTFGCMVFSGCLTGALMNYSLNADLKRKIKKMEQEYNSGCTKDELKDYGEKFFGSLEHKIEWAVRNDPFDDNKLCIVARKNHDSVEETEFDYMKEWNSKIAGTQFENVKLYLL